MADGFSDYKKSSGHKAFGRLRPGHREPMGDFITQNYNEILHFCIYQLHDADMAFDITQETFLRFIKNADSLASKNLKGYLLTIARNLCVDYWNGCKREQTTDFSTQNDDAGHDSRAALSEYEQVENNLILTDLLSKLPAEQREIVILRYYNDLKLGEISKILGVNLSTVKSRLRLGIQRLRKLLDL